MISKGKEGVRGDRLEKGKSEERIEGWNEEWCNWMWNVVEYVKG
nr:hypothetical protein [Bacillus sp. WP8]